MTTVLSPEQWQEQAELHRQRAESLTAEHLERRRAGRKHPIFDFLFEYYPTKPAQLARWHPGVGVLLEGNPPHAGWRDYTTFSDGVGVDVRSVWKRRKEALLYIETLLSSTITNPAHFDCFGFHEWAMVYKTDTPRHDLGLRLTREETNQVVESHNIRCTHYDAFRFFTTPARPLNFRVLEPSDQVASDQVGCLHVTMDLYKWATKLGPLVPGPLWLDCFELARDVRILDMEASPYDVRPLGFGVVEIEKSSGKLEYVTRQRLFSRRAAPLRQQLIEIIKNTSTGLPA